MGSAVDKPGELLVGNHENVSKAMEGTSFNWEDTNIHENCTWNEFQGKTSGSNKDKADAYYKFTGKEKDVSARQEYMGSTPQKDSPTGREVIARMFGEDLEALQSGTITESRFDIPKDREGRKCRKYLENAAKYFAAGEPIPPIPKNILKCLLEKVKYDKRKIREYDMGHSPKDAVKKWNELFSLLGEKEGKRYARMWMKLSENYELQHKGDNRSAGGALGQTEGGTYVKPADDENDILAALENNKEELEKIEQEYAEYQKKYGKNKHSEV